MITVDDLAMSGAQLLEDDERTFADMDDRLGRLRVIHATETHDCAAIMAELKAKQDRRKRSWIGRLFG